MKYDLQFLHVKIFLLSPNAYLEGSASNFSSPRAFLRGQSLEFLKIPEYIQRRPTYKGRGRNSCKSHGYLPESWVGGGVVNF